MITFMVIATFLQAILFKWQGLIQKRFFENGMSRLGVMYYQAFAILPGIVLLLISYKKEYIDFLTNHWILMGILFFSSFLWMLIEYLKMLPAQAIYSMSFLNAFSGIIKVPIYLLIGIFLNSDMPNLSVLFSLALLAAAVYIQPAPKTKDADKQFKKNMLIMVLTLAGGYVLGALNMAAYRYFMKEIDAVLFGLSAAIVLSMLVIVIFFVFQKKHRRNVKNDLKEYSYLLFIFPAIWFIASIFEGYSVASVPIYTIAGIASFTFLIDIFSDLWNKRIIFNTRTLIFVAFVLGSTFLSVFSLY